MIVERDTKLVVAGMVAAAMFVGFED